MPERKQKRTASQVKLPLYSASHEKVGELEVAATSSAATAISRCCTKRCGCRWRIGARVTASTKPKGLVSGGGASRGGRRAPAVRARIRRDRRLATWRNDLRTAAARLFVQDAEEGVAAALCSALSDRANNGKLFVVESLELASRRPRRRNSALGARRLHALFSRRGDGKLFRAARDLATHQGTPIVGLNVYDVLNYDESDDDQGPRKRSRRG